MSVEWGSMLKPDIIPGHPLEANMAALESARADMEPCRHYTHMSDPYVRVQVMAAGGYSGDPLSDSNAATLENMANAWIDDERCGAGETDSSAPDVDWHPMTGNGSSATAVCVNASTVDADLLAEIIGVAEGYADYPVLDESDYSEREWADWTHAVEWEAREIPEHLQSRFCELIGEHYGEAEPGYVATEWVLDAMRDLGLVGRRVRLEGTRQWAARNLQVMVRDRDMEWSWRVTGRLYA